MENMALVGVGRGGGVSTGSVAGMHRQAGSHLAVMVPTAPQSSGYTQCTVHYKP